MMDHLGRKDAAKLRSIILVAIILVAAFLAACEKPYEGRKKERATRVERLNTLNVAVVWDKNVSDFLLVEGVMLAAEEINSAGGVLGKPVRIKVHYSAVAEPESALAKKIANDTSIAAVIGHRSSEDAIPASITYEYSGLLFISPSSSNANLTNHGFQFTFRTIASDRYVSRDIAAFIKRQGHRKVAVIDDRGVYGKGLANGVMEALADIGVETSTRRHYLPGRTDFKDLAAELARSDFDAIFLGGTLPYAAEFIREARKMGVQMRVYGGAALDSWVLQKIAGEAALGTVVPTSFNPHRNHPLTREFVRKFESHYQRRPDTRAALGYDSLHLLAEAMERSKSTDPAVVASHMRFLADWQGVTGSYTYNRVGDVVGKESYFKYLTESGFVFFDDQPAADAEGGETSP